ncbi:MAG: secondary thiamine-phosphate synthase enzyme YjbQ [Candidatus Eisenbacteria sp.]|nr:secondary thiamine-phosphate synthase enzyme YjbQ [Candidatus Eisenbacteria bacterium]
MQVCTEAISLEATGFCDIRDITPEVERMLRERGLIEGSVLLFVGGSTGALTTIEFEPGAVADLRAAIERLLPQAIPYAHDARWGDGNGFSHVRAALLQADLEVPVAEGNLLLGTWQQIVFCDFDNRSRRRKIICQLRGRFD